MRGKVLPVIDLSLAKGATRGALVKQLREALTTVGFIYLKNVEGFEEEELLRLTKWFFSLPEEQRMAVSRRSFDSSCSNEYRGYFPVLPGAVSHKEGFEMGPKMEFRKGVFKTIEEKYFVEENQWPLVDTEEGKYFKTWMETYHHKMTESALEILRLIAEGFGAPTEFYTDLFTSPNLSTLRLIRYPARPNPPDAARDGDAVIQTAEHMDSVMITLLATFAEYPGLQVRWWEDDSILDVEHKPGHMVMNIGELLSYTSGGQLKATRHRVIDCCGDRFSVPFFLEPRFDANVNVTLPGCEPRDTKTKLYGPWLQDSIRKWAEYKSLFQRLDEEAASKNLYRNSNGETTDIIKSDQF